MSINRDAKLAIYVLVATFLLGMVAGCVARDAWACDSFVSCMVEAKSLAVNSCLNGCDGTGCKSMCEDADTTWHFYENVNTEHRGFAVLYLKAIAFKLHEISQKLDVKNR